MFQNRMERIIYITCYQEVQGINMETETKKLLRPKEVREILGGIARSTFYNYRDQDEFPDPVKIDGVVGFWSDEIYEFAESHRKGNQGAT